MSKLSLARMHLFLSLVLSALAHAQAPNPPSPSTPESKPPTYDVMSIRPNKSGSGSVRISTHDGILSATNVSLKDLLQGAYDIKQDLISGIPGPIDSVRFDIEAKVIEPDVKALDRLTSLERWQMILPLLTERFQIKAHTEAKTLPVYEMVLLPGGPKFKPSPSESKNGNTSVHRGTELAELTAQEVPMVSLAETLAGQVHRTVLDKTGLTGNYDLSLKWTPDNAPDTQTDAPPGIFTALQEQLGLKLQSAKGPVETLVVDHVEMPTEN